MASAAPNQNLPLFYREIVPRNATQHGNMKIHQVEKSPFIAQTHAIPITVDEFGLAQRNYPIVFSIGENPIPIALIGAAIRMRRLVVTPAGGIGTAHRVCRQQEVFALGRISGGHVILARIIWR